MNGSLSRIIGTLKWLDDLRARWKHRNVPLYCPNCKKKASAETFAKGRYKLHSESLQCEICGKSHPLYLWRTTNVLGPLT